jgi:hypothetical protein
MQVRHLKTLVLTLAVWVITSHANGGSLVDSAPITQAKPSDSPFQLQIGFPVWIPFPEGDIGTRLPNRPEGVDRIHAHIHPFSNVGAFGYIIPLSVEMQKFRWLLQVSGYYLNLSTTVEPRGPLYKSGSLDWNSGLLDVALGYRVIDQGPFSLDFLVGGRYQHVDLNFSLKPEAGHLVRGSAADSRDWADPFIRLVGKARLARPVTMFLKGDIGGFGVSSDLTWTVYGGFEFQIARHFYTDIGCRYFGTDYSSGTFKYDVSMIGPQIELGVSF